MFVGLIKNEFIKLYSKKKTFIILFLFMALSGVLIAVNESNENNYLQSKSPEFLIQNLEEQIGYQEDYLESVKNDSNYSKEEKEIEIKNAETSLEYTNEELKNAKLALENQDSYDWHEDVKTQIKELKEMNDNSIDEGSKEYNSKEIIRLQTSLDYNIPIDEEYLNKGINYIILNITLVAAGFLAFGLILFNADSVSNEYNPGTLKFLLIQPVSRIKILLSKFIVMILSSLGLIMGTQGLFCVGVGLVKGFGSLNRPILAGIKYEFIMENGLKVLNEVGNSGTYISLSSYLLKALSLEALYIIVMVSFIFMISTISKSSVISMTIAIGALLASNIIYMLSTTYRSFSPFIFLHYSNIEGIIKGTIVHETRSLYFTYPNVVIISLITSIVFLMISLLVFKKRDIQI